MSYIKVFGAPMGTSTATVFTPAWPLDAGNPGGPFAGQDPVIGFNRAAANVNPFGAGAIYPWFQPTSAGKKFIAQGGCSAYVAAAPKPVRIEIQLQQWSAPNGTFEGRFGDMLCFDLNCNLVAHEALVGPRRAPGTVTDFNVGEVFPLDATKWYMWAMNVSAADASLTDGRFDFGDHIQVELVEVS